jgi:hypothetical protein
MKEATLQHYETVSRTEQHRGPLPPPRAGVPRFTVEANASTVPRFVIGQQRPIPPEQPDVPRLIVDIKHPKTDTQGRPLMPRLVVGPKLPHATDIPQTIQQEDTPTESPQAAPVVPQEETSEHRPSGRLQELSSGSAGEGDGFVDRSSARTSARWHDVAPAAPSAQLTGGTAQALVTLHSS